MRKKLDLSGMRFKDWEVLSFAGTNKHNQSLWECMCSCGKIYIIVGNSLVQGKSTQCMECYTRKVKNVQEVKQQQQRQRRQQLQTLLKGDHRNRVLTDCGVYISATLWDNIVKGAKERGLIIAITKNFIGNLYLQQGGKCALSGIDITLPDKTRTSDYTASLDRIESGRGYSEDNVQWVHKKINMMKRNMSDSEFINFCKMVAAHNE